MWARSCPTAAVAFSALLAACGLIPARDAQVTDTATTVAAAPELLPEETAAVLHPEVRRACASAAAYWRAEPRIAMRSFDSVLTLPRSASVTDACFVTLRLEDDPLQPWDSDQQRVPFVASGWLSVYEFDADGKDGRSRVYQLDPVRCQVAERWDGGDDEDSTYVPAPWFEQSVACWRR
jgi:hypothetical protein